ncbi:MAG: nucleotidyltransferase domain-containing protein [Weeksellaceae bacterium]
MLQPYQRYEVNEIIETLAKNLDISESQHNAAIKSYQAVGNWLTKDDSELSQYNPTIAPQGSFIIGTIIQPIDPEGDIDLDIVCELKGKKIHWTQKDLKDLVGNQLIKHKTYNSLLDEEGRRCWTLKYRENSDSSEKYHMDILPAINTHGHSVILSKQLTNLESTDYKELLISITDKEKLPEYYIETNPLNWLQSNPFGYAKWFMVMANKYSGVKTKMFSFRNAVKPTPDYQTNKLPLQRVVQLLKRHRDIMFQDYNSEDKKEKPISCIITTLAAKAYSGEDNILDALYNVIYRMENFIESKYDYDLGREISWISNPVNENENFADRWALPNSKREKFFHEWVDKLKNDLDIFKKDFNRKDLHKRLKTSFGVDPVDRTFSQIATLRMEQTKNGVNKIDRELGLLGTVSTTSNTISNVKPHTFFGNE